MPAADILAGLRQRLAGRTGLWNREANEMLQATLDHLKSMPDNEAIEFAIAGLRMIRDERENWIPLILNQAVGQVLRRKLPFSEDQVIEMIGLASVPHREFPFKGILKAVEGLPMTPRMMDALRRLSPCITEYLGGSAMRDLHARIEVLISGPAPDTAIPVQGAWSQIVFQEISQSPQREAWERIFRHAADLKSSEASQKWRAAAKKLMSEIGREAFLALAVRWLSLGPSPDRPGIQISTGESDYEKGFVWFLAGDSDSRLPVLLANFAERALRKIPNLGAVSQKVGNACVNVLAELPGLEAVSQLSRLAERVKYDTAQRLIQEALTRAAEKAGVSREQLEEMSTPDCGLSGDGTRTERFGEYGARLSIEDASTRIDWSDAQGNPLTGAPAFVKEHHAAGWKEFQAAAKEIGKMLGAQRARLERLLVTQRSIPVETLRACYLDHPLLGGMARRLIWKFDCGPGIWHDGHMAGETGREIDLAAQKSARLWHPVLSDVAVIFHWRCWLEDHHIRQPFKQAHREVYLLTDAERTTATYSNRFAAHILRQHIFAALCAQRGWAFRLMGRWDSHNTPTLDLPDPGLRIQYDVDFPRNENEVSDNQIYMLIRTGALRFCDTRSVPQPLESIPPVILSEVMRDVDLFTGVASIGADPAWGLQETIPFREYWNEASFGDLTEMAQNRGRILARLIPQLAIRDRCSVEQRFLVVRGDRATYKIHLGSSNVLMEPGSRYLCIREGAATKSTPRDVFLPFDEDHTLSLILSKAFLLAEDRKIKDQVLLRQLPLA